MNNPLSAFNTAAALQEYICDALLSSAELNSLSVHFLAENRQDIDYEIKRNLMQQGLVGLVMTPEMSYIGHDGAEVSYDVRGLTIQIVESVPVNRASNKVSCVTGLDVANYVQSYLGGPQAAIGFGQLCPVSIQQGEDNGLIVTKVTFDTRVDGGYGGRFEPVSSHVVFNPYVTRNDISDIIGMSADWDAMSALLSAAVDGISAKADISAVAAISTDLSDAISSLEKDVDLSVRSLSGYLKEEFYTKDQTSSATEIHDSLSTLERDVDLSVHNLSTYLKDEFYTKSETSSATEIHDALSSLEKDVDLSVSNLSNYLKEEFYTKSQTSSAVELKDALSAKADLSGATFTGSVHIGAGDLWVRDWDNILQKDGQSLLAPLSERPVKDTIAISYSDETHKITLKVDDLSTYVDATDFIKDGMVNNVYFDTVTKELVITFNTDAGKAPIRIPVDQFAKLYTAGDGLQLSGEEFSVDWTKIYKKTETSSSNEIQDALDDKRDNTDNTCYKTIEWVHGDPPEGYSFLKDWPQPIWAGNYWIWRLADNQYPGQQAQFHADVDDPDAQELEFEYALRYKFKAFRRKVATKGQTFVTYDCVSSIVEDLDLSDYYMKSETSSSTELCGAFQEISNYVDGIDVAVFGGDKNHDVTYMIPVYKFADALSTINERIGHEPLPENPDIYDIVQNVVDIYDYYGIPSPEIATLGDLLRALNDIVISTDLSSDFTFSIKQVLEELNKDFCKQNVDAMLLSAAYDRLELSARNFITERQSKDLHYLKNQTSSSVELAYAFDHIQLSDYYLKTETSSAAEISDALKNIELSDYYLKSETSSAEELSIEFQKSSHDDVLSGEVAKLEVALYGGDRDMNVTSALYLKHLGDQIWAADNMLSIPAPADAELTSLILNVAQIYDHFGKPAPRMEDLPSLFNAVHEIALNTELSSVFKLSMKQAVYDLTDDVTKLNGDVIRLSSQIKHINMPTRMSQLSNDVGFTTSADMFQYTYPKSQLSTAQEIAEALDNIEVSVDLSAYYKKTETSSSTQLYNKFLRVDARLLEHDNTLKNLPSESYVDAGLQKKVDADYVPGTTRTWHKALCFDTVMPMPSSYVISPGTDMSFVSYKNTFYVRWDGDDCYIKCTNNIERRAPWLIRNDQTGEVTDQINVEIKFTIGQTGDLRDGDEDWDPIYVLRNVREVVTEEHYKTLQESFDSRLSAYAEKPQISSYVPYMTVTGVDSDGVTHTYKMFMQEI